MTNDASETAPVTVTVAIERAIAPERIAATLADLSRLPEWAPALADRVEQIDTAHWTAHGAQGSVTVTVVADAATGVVDILSDRGGDLQGARFRAMPRPGGGSVVTMTMPTFEGDEAASRAVAQRELEAVAALVR